MNLIILYSTFSAKGKSGKIAAELAAALKAQAVSCTVFENDWPATLPADVNYAVVIGGDGTFNYFTNRYPASRIPVILMAGGTGNDFYWKVHGTKSNEAQQKDILSLASGNATDHTISETDVGKYATDDAPHRYFLNSVGLGFDGEVLRSMKTIRWLGGHLGYLFVVVKKLFTYREPEFDFVTPAGSYTKSCTLVNVANSSRTGGGFLISPHASVTDNQLNLYHCTAPGLLQRLKTLLQVEKGKHINNQTAVYVPLKKLEVKASRKLYSQADGELIEGQHYTFALADWKLPLVVFKASGKQ